MVLAISPIHRYDLQHKISENSGKQTFIAQDLRTQTPVIVKIIPLNQLFQWAELKLFEREATILQSLGHPAIPKFIDYFEADIEGVHSFVLVQSYLAAESLETHLKLGRRFSASEIREIAQQMLTLLHYLHQQSPPVIHRDIKPSNILLSSTNDVYLVDFGAVHTSLTKENGTITIVGSYGYIPLEQFSGQSCPASDLYSLGMTLISLMTGLHPAELPQAEGKVQLQGLIQDRENASQIQRQRAFSQWLERMVEPYLYKRFQSADEAMTALELTKGGMGYYRHLKPEHSGVEVKREANVLKILMPVRFSLSPFVKFIAKFFLFSLALMAVLLFLTLLESGLGLSSDFLMLVKGMLSVIFFWTSSSIPLEFNLGLAAGFFLLVGWIPVVVLFWTSPFILFSLIKSICTVAAGDRVISIHRTRGLRAGTRRTNKSHIRWNLVLPPFTKNDLVAYSPGYTFSEYFDGIDSKIKQSSGSEPHKLSLYAGSTEYVVGDRTLSRAELWWLGQEISDFLGQELQTIYATPVVSPAPENSCGCGC